jgi:hypothetical protein
MGREAKFLGLILIAAGLYFLLVFNRGISMVDEGFVLHLAQMVTRGQVPCRDFFYHAIPGTLYIHASLFSLFGEKLIMVRVYALFQAIITVWLFFRVARTFQRVPFAYFSALLAVPWNILVFYRMAHYNVDSIFFALCTLFCILGFARKKSWPWVLGAGLAAGITLICKQNIGLLICLFAVFATALTRDSAFSLNKRLIMVFIPMVAPLAVLLVYFVSQGALFDLYQVVVVEAIQSKQHWLVNLILWRGLQSLFFILVYFGIIFLFSLWLKKARGGSGRSREIAWVSIIIFHLVIFSFLILAGHFFTAIFPLLLIASAVFASWKDHQTAGDERYCRNLTIVFVGLIYVGGLSSGVDVTHNLLSFSPALVITGYLIQVAISRSGEKMSRGRFRMAAAVLVFMLLVGFVYPFTPFGVLVFHEPWWKACKKVDLPRLQGIRVSEETKHEIESIYEIVNINTAPGEPILVFPIGSFYYFITERPAPFFQEFFFYEVFFAHQQDELIQGMEDQKIRLILLPAREGELGGLLDAGYLSKVYQYIYQHYEFHERCGRYEVYLLSEV